MRRHVILFLACVAALLVACEKNSLLTEQDPVISEAKTYFREGVAPVSLSAGHETRTQLGEDNYVLWNLGDEISVIKEGDNCLRLLGADMVSAMKVGERKTILLVNPANSGCFLGFNGTERVRYSNGLSSLSSGSDQTGEKMGILFGLAENLRNNTDYLFTLERVDEGWLLYHKASGKGLESGGTKISKDQYHCALGSEIVPVDITTGGGNIGGSNVVTGCSELVYIRKMGDPADGYYLWSGGNGSEKLSWVSVSDSNSWTPWLIFEDPQTSFPFTADSDGAKTTFTNKTGFSAGDDTWYAFYPASDKPCCFDGIMPFFLPEVQTYQARSFAKGANVSVGVLADGQITFHSVLGVLKLSVKGTQRVQSISVKDNAGMPLWGEGVISVSSIGADNWAATVFSTNSDGSDIVTLDCGEGVDLQENEATDFYIVVPVGAFANGFEVEIATNLGNFTKTTHKDNTIARGDIKKMPGFTLRNSDLPIPEFDIQNEVVKAYMAIGPYNSFGETSYFTYSAVSSLASQYGWSADKPASLPISWNGGTSASISITENGENWYTVDGISGGSYTITNLTPGCIYAYTVKENGSILDRGEFKAVGQVRMVSITDSWNCRDLGGWTGLDGHTIKYGKIFRTASLNGQYIGPSNPSLSDVANPDLYVFHGQADIVRLGIKAELDLRGDPNIPGQWGKEGSVHSASLQATKLDGADFQRIMTDYGLMYPRRRSSVIQDVAWIIKELKLGRPVAFHCRIGADRTGALAFLIEGLLGVHEGDIARDYELTSLTSFDSNRRYASDARYDFFKKKDSGSGIGIRDLPQGDNLQEKCYYYLNQYFDDVHINADDLDWFICEMLGLDVYSPPSWAINYDNNSLDNVVSISTGSGSYTYP